MNPVLAMTRGLDVQLWVGLMEIKGHFVSQNVIAFGAIDYQMRRPLRKLGVPDCLGWCLLWEQRDLGQGLCSSGTLDLCSRSAWMVICSGSQVGSQVTTFNSSFSAM